MDDKTEIRTLLTHARAARHLGVCTRTLDRWCDAGTLPSPTIIHNRKYHVAADLERVGQVGRAKAPEALRRAKLEREARNAEEAAASTEAA
jgi:predicted site-specific integrase-resolvase